MFATRQATREANRLFSTMSLMTEEETEHLLGDETKPVPAEGQDDGQREQLVAPKGLTRPTRGMECI